jgi:hypothetical protein
MGIEFLERERKEGQVLGKVIVAIAIVLRRLIPMALGMDQIRACESIV